MGATGREFMQIRMMEEDYNEVPPHIRQRMEIQYIDVDDIDYSHDELWCRLDREASKAYKEKKKREFDLRHNK